MYEDPVTKLDNITDVTDASRNFTVLKYATKISNNTFANNYAGMKGSALMAVKINELQIESNVFRANGPVTSFEEATYSPYYKYLALQARNLTLNTMFAGNICFDLEHEILNEFSYIECCYRALESIDMPALQGALYIENCEGDRATCFTPIFNSYT